MLPNAIMVRARSARRALLVFLLLCLPVSLTAGIGTGYGTRDSVTPAATGHAPGPSRAIGRVAGENTPARLRAYREAVQRLDRLTRLHALSERRLARLQATPAPEHSEADPGGDHEVELAAARASHAALSRKVKQAEAARQARLNDLTGGRLLPAGDLAALHQMLGL